MTSLVDIWLVARFEIFRAYRTRMAMSVLVLYGLGMSVAVWVFSKILYSVENVMSSSLGVPMTERPGHLLPAVLSSENFVSGVSTMPGGAEILEVVQTTPILGVVVLWVGLGMVPFFAATTSAESIAMDRSGRALRYEVARTGRFEFVMGRYLGRAILTLIATLVAGAVATAVGLYLIELPNPGLQLAFVLAFSLKTWVYSLVYLGIGLGFSQMTASPAWARVLALSATVGVWVAYGLASAMVAMGVAADFFSALLPLFPPYWVGSFWGSATDILMASVVCVALSLCSLFVGFTWFSRVDL